MSLFRQIAVRCTVVLCVMTQLANSQNTILPEAHRWGAAIAVDAGTLPDELSLQCRSVGGGIPSIGGGITGFFRPGRWFILAADTRASAVPGSIGCAMNLPAPVRVGPNELEVRSGLLYPEGTPTPPLIRSAFRVGLETPPGWPLLRATLGSGFIWSSNSIPFGSAAFGVGSRGRGVRFYAELERSVSRMRVREDYMRMRTDSSSSQLVPARTVSTLLHPRWTTVHVGVEFPLTPNR